MQLEWFEEDFRDCFADLKSAMFSRWNEIDTLVESTYGWTDPSGRERTGVRYRNHPAKFGEFHTYHGRLKEHIEAKVGSRLVAMTIRGVVDFGQKAVGDLPFDLVEDGGDVTRERWLGTSQASSWGGESRLGESLKAWWTYDPRIMSDLSERRTFDARSLVESYVKDYLRRRHSLPFVVLGREEVGLLVHPPSSDLEGLRTTRGEQLPQPRNRGGAEKAGIQVAGRSTTRA